MQGTSKHIIVIYLDLRYCNIDGVHIWCISALQAKIRGPSGKFVGTRLAMTVGNAFRQPALTACNIVQLAKTRQWFA